MKIIVNYQLLYLCSLLFGVAAFAHRKFPSWLTTSLLFASGKGDSAPNYLHTTEYKSDNYSHVLGYSDPDHTPSKLQEISAKCIADVIQNKKPIDTQGCGIDRSFYVSADELRSDIIDFDEQYGAPLNLYDKLEAVYQATNNVGIAAEFKRASPSKGDINIGLDAATQCLQYAAMGAAVISVLTEFRYFKGNLRDMKNVRLAIQRQYPAAVASSITAQQLASSRPLILRKDFIFDRYQILEARAAGADTVLLIVAVLGVQQLQDLITFARMYQMEPLVEVNNPQEMQVALEAGAKVIGINNRNLHTFSLDMTTTERCMQVSDAWIASHQSASPPIVCALSGIGQREDVQAFFELGVRCVLVGETLMKSSDPAAKIQELLLWRKKNGAEDIQVDPSGQLSHQQQPMKQQQLLVKVCGLTSQEAVSAALSSGVNLLGIIMVPSSKRSMHDRLDIVKYEIVETVQRYGERLAQPAVVQEPLLAAMKAYSPGQDDAVSWYRQMMDLLSTITISRPLTVGVFQDHPDIDEMNRIVQTTGIDLIQLHGQEPPEIVNQLSVPVIKVIHIAIDEATTLDGQVKILQQIKHEARQWAGKAIALLLDASVSSSSSSGGTGKAFDWSLFSRNIIEQQQLPPVLLAGGITLDNLPRIIDGQLDHKVIVGIDVNSGVEASPGVKDPAKIKQLMHMMRSK